VSLTSGLKRTARKVEKALTGEEPEIDLLDTLREEHEQVAVLLEQLVESSSAGKRRALLAEIKANLIPHLRAEEKILYDALIANRAKAVQQNGEEGHIEHQLADRTLKLLEKMDSPTSAGFGAGAKVLKELVEHHVEEEENNVWSDAKRLFTADQRKRMNRQYLAAKARVRVS
jgi:hypothetical protein